MLEGLTRSLSSFVVRRSCSIVHSVSRPLLIGGLRFVVLCLIPPVTLQLHTGVDVLVRTVSRISVMALVVSLCLNPWCRVLMLVVRLLTVCSTVRSVSVCLR